MSQPSTTLYRLIAQAAARRLGAFDFVESVYTRRSVACGEVEFGRSDVDVHILIRPFAEAREEARALLRLTERFARLRRFFLVLGDCDVSTRAELESWYRLRPVTWYRDRGWLRLYGEEFVRPRVSLGVDDNRESILGWFFWARENLPRFFRAGNVRTCKNLFLDMVNAVCLYTGEFEGAKSRAEVLRHWLDAAPTAREWAGVLQHRRRRAVGDRRDLVRRLYRESLVLGHELATSVAPNLDWENSCEQLPSVVPFTFAKRNYLLVDPFRPEQVERALTLMEEDATVFVTTTAAFAVYLHHRNPWEYYTARHAGQPPPCSPPPARALRQAVQLSLTRELPRRVGCTLGRKGKNSAAVGLQYAQYRLYADYEIIADNAEDIRRQYRRCYGEWPYTGTAAREIYFQRDYPVLCQTIEALIEQGY